MRTAWLRADADARDATRSRLVSPRRSRGSWPDGACFLSLVCSDRRRSAARIALVFGRALAQIEGRKCGMLMELDEPFAHQFERGREARRHRGGALRRLDHIGDQVLV